MSTTNAIEWAGLRFRHEVVCPAGREEVTPRARAAYGVLAGDGTGIRIAELVDHGFPPSRHRERQRFYDHYYATAAWRYERALRDGGLPGLLRELVAQIQRRGVRAVARAAGVGADRVSRLVNGRIQDPRWATFQKIVEATDARPTLQLFTRPPVGADRRERFRWRFYVWEPQPAPVLLSRLGHVQEHLLPDLADELECDASHLQRLLERPGPANPSLSLVLRLSRALEATIGFVALEPDSEPRVPRPWYEGARLSIRCPRTGSLPYRCSVVEEQAATAASPVRHLDPADYAAPAHAGRRGEERRHRGATSSSPQRSRQTIASGQVAELVVVALPHDDDDYYRRDEPRLRALLASIGELVHALAWDETPVLLTGGEELLRKLWPWWRFGRLQRYVRSIPVAAWLDLWIRDYAPIPRPRGQGLLLFRYDAHDWTAKFRREQQGFQEELVWLLRQWGLPFEDRREIVLHGGNVVDNGYDALVVTDQVLADNPHWDHARAWSELRRYFAVEHVAIVPRDPEDPHGHADGLVCWLGPRRLLVQRFATGGACAYDTELEAALRRQLPEVELVPIHGGSPGRGRRVRGYEPSWELRVNAVTTLQRLYLPTYGARELGASRIVGALDPSHTQPRQPRYVDARGLAPFGGGPRCATWVLRGEPARTLWRQARPL